MKELMKAVSEWLSQGEDVIMATIIADSGSTPRGAGARMAIIRNGDFVGTIGGGAIEYKVQLVAQETLNDKTSQIKTFILSPNDKEDLGMICGGNVTVYIQYISASDENTRTLFAYGTSLFSQNIDSWLVTDISKETDWNMEIYTANENNGKALPEDMREEGFFSNRGLQIKFLGRKYYSEPLTRAGKVYVFGGGHVSQKLVPLLSQLEFSCYVFDSLDKFANKKLFPTAIQVITGDFHRISDNISITENDYIVILTRGHNFDFIVQAQALNCNPRYIGVIGSRSKIAIVSAKLLEQGFSQEQIDRVYTPIGIDIKADTPAEIAVSIAAEMIMVRAKAAKSDFTPKLIKDCC